MISSDSGLGENGVWRAEGEDKGRPRLLNCWSYASYVRFMRFGCRHRD
jgi:hypothetical protein